MAQVDYPHLYDHAMGHMPCAKTENKVVATGLFTDICPSGFMIDQVYPFSAKTKPYCRWLVKFVKANEEQLPPPGTELRKVFNMLTRYIPATNAKVLEKQYGGSDGAFITYAVQCECNKPFEFDYDALSPPQIKWPVKEEFTDLSAINCSMGNLDESSIFKTETE